MNAIMALSDPVLSPSASEAWDAMHVAVCNASANTGKTATAECYVATEDSDISAAYASAQT